ncbi:hypothetical protein V496_01604 [Pseudogymnoascus sp. VKM F-4515 (FW-2607)]|nr:hypothetical protein V496_01604 [Pseudogymnoascus sp. VKM F-4515 (FW-2607)]
MASPKTILIQLLYINDCQLVEAVRAALAASLAGTQVPVTVTETMCDCSSPTLLVNGSDVTGRLRMSTTELSCRLDLPTKEQISAAIRGLDSTSRQH